MVCVRSSLVTIGNSVVTRDWSFRQQVATKVCKISSRKRFEMSLPLQSWRARWRIHHTRTLQKSVCTTHSGRIPCNNILTLTPQTWYFHTDNLSNTYVTKLCLCNAQCSYTPHIRQILCHTRTSQSFVRTIHSAIDLIVYWHSSHTNVTKLCSHNTQFNRPHRILTLITHVRHRALSAQRPLQQT